jgi:hypothetical protein
MATDSDTWSRYGKRTENPRVGCLFDTENTFRYTTNIMISRSSPAKRPHGRPKNLELSDEDRRLHRRANLSAEIAERKRKRYPESTVTVTLTMGHNHNGTVYGPGTVTVPHGLAQSLLHTEQLNQQAEERLHSARGYMIGPRGQTGHLVKQVPVEFFDFSDGSREETSEEYFSRVQWRPPEPKWRSLP